MARVFSLLLIAVAMACLLSVSAATKEHVVGGNFGWQKPQKASFYQDWANSRTFAVGDKIVFPDTMSPHSVVEVMKPDFDECEQTDVVNMYFRGPTEIELTETGMRYFFCNVAMHCEAGQKFSIDVRPRKA